MSSAGAVLWVEDFVDGITYEGHRVIALSPEASYALKQKRIPHGRPEDHDPDFSAFEDRYFEEFLEGLDGLDDWLAGRVSHPDIRELGLFRHHWLRIKTLFDALIVLALRMRGCLEGERPESIEYLCFAPNEKAIGHSLMGFNDNSRRFMRPMAVLCAKELGIPIRFLDAPRTTSAPVSQRRPDRPLPGKRKELLKAAYFFMKYKKMARLFRRSAEGQAVRAFFTALGSNDMDPIAADLIERGATVYLREGGWISEVSSWVHRRVFDLDGVVPEDRRRRWREEFSEAAEHIREQKGFFDRLSGYAGVRLEAAALPYLEEFLRGRGVEALGEFEAMKRFMLEKNVNRLIVRESTQYLNTVPLLAARSLGTVKRVCFQHGGFLSESKIWRLSQTDLMDQYFAWGPESRDYTLSELSSGPHPGCEVREYAHFFAGAGKRRSAVRAKETLFYLPTKALTGLERLNMAAYPAVWYFDLQLAILEYLNTVKDKEIVLKYVGEGGGWFKATTLDHVKKKLTNIRIISTPFSKCLSLADRVLMDIPSTALYQASAARIPVMALYNERVRLRRSCISYFGKSLQSYRDTREALEKITAFVEGDPAEYAEDRFLTPKPDAVEAVMAGAHQRAVVHQGAATR